MAASTLKVASGERAGYLEKELERVAKIMQTDDEQRQQQLQAKLKDGPVVFPPLTPYSEVHEARFLNKLPDSPRGSYGYRYMASTLCDPWLDLTMDRVLLPKVAIKQRHPKKAKQSCKLSRERPPKEGSTRLPKYPVVTLPTNEKYWSDLVSKTLWYNDVVELREKIAEKYGVEVPERVDRDYVRTKQDFYRMELDRFDAYHPKNRHRMKMTYKAYLQNTPGSRKALNDGIREAERALRRAQLANQCQAVC